MDLISIALAKNSVAAAKKYTDSKINDISSEVVEQASSAITAAASQAASQEV